MPDVPVAPIGAHPMLVLLLQLGLLLTLATLLGRLATRLRMPPIVGELAAGVLVGPSLLGNLAPAVSGWLLPRNAEQVHLLDAVGQYVAIEDGAFKDGLGAGRHLWCFVTHSLYFPFQVYISPGIFGAWLPSRCPGTERPWRSAE